MNLSPTPQTYSAAYGGKPGQLTAPQSIFEQLNQNVPDYANLTSSATSGVKSQLAGRLDPSTMRNIWDSAAARGVSLGQPNSALSNMIGLNLTGNTSQNLINTGIGNYGNLSNLWGSQQLSPELMSGIQAQNSVWNAAPDPKAVADQQKSDYYDALSNQFNQSLLHSMTTGGGGSGYGGTGGGGRSAMSDYSAPQAPLLSYDSSGLPLGYGSSMSGGNSSTWLGNESGKTYLQGIGFMPSDSPWVTGDLSK